MTRPEPAGSAASALAAAGFAAGAFRRLPAISGKPPRIVFRPALTARGNALLSGEDAGRPVHAGSFPRRRLMVLDQALLEQPAELARILVHELFHFVWPRLGNPLRRSYERLLEAEMGRRARGELGYSAESAKLRLTAVDRASRSRRWREYACESFCDTAAWLYSGVRRHGEYTLAGAFRRRRRAWFRNLERRPLPI